MRRCILHILERLVISTCLVWRGYRYQPLYFKEVRDINLSVLERLVISTLHFREASDISLSILERSVISEKYCLCSYLCSVLL